jgi:hypothetical protein
MPASCATNLYALVSNLGIVELELCLALFALDNHLRLPGEDWNWVYRMVELPETTLVSIAE